MRRCHQHCSGPGLGQAVNVEAVVVDGNWHRVEPGAAGDDVVLTRAGILEGDALETVLCQRGEGEGQSLTEARDDEGVLGDGEARPNAAVICGDHLSQVPGTGRVFVTQFGGRKGPR
jgi:hypothetical protein